MNLVAIDGYLGSGKTLGMTILGVYFQMKSGCTLYSNYNVNGSLPFNHYNDFLHVAQQKSSIILLDEAHSDLDARNFNTNAVKFFTHLVFYFRKMRTTMFMATPLFENLDSRVRSICNLYIHVSKTKTHFKYEMYDIQSMRYLRTYKIEIEKAKQIAKMVYSTYNMVTPVEFPADRKEFNDFVHQLKSINDDYHKNPLDIEQPNSVRQAI